MNTYAILKNGKDTGMSVEACRYSQAYARMRALINLGSLFETLEYRVVRLGA